MLQDPSQKLQGPPRSASVPVSLLCMRISGPAGFLSVLPTDQGFSHFSTFAPLYVRDRLPHPTFSRMRHQCSLSCIKWVPPSVPHCFLQPTHAASLLAFNSVYNLQFLLVYISPTCWPTGVMRAVFRFLLIAWQRTLFVVNIQYVFVE